MEATRASSTSGWMSRRRIAAAGGQVLLDAAGAHHRGGDAAEREAGGLAVGDADGGQDHLGDRLRGARAHLAEILRALGWLGLDAHDQLVGATHAAAVA